MNEREERSLDELWEELERERQREREEAERLAAERARDEKQDK